MIIAEVCVNVAANSVRQNFIYLVPERLKFLAAGWRVIVPFGAQKLDGFVMKMRFSPGYGDWALTNQKNFFTITGADEIGMSLSSAMMLMPRKSITAIIGLEKNKLNVINSSDSKCVNCSNLDCPARQ